MSAEDKLYAAVKDIAGLGERVYPDIVPLDKELPAIAYEKTDTETHATIHNAIYARTVTFAIYCHDKTRESVVALGDLVEAACIAADFIPTSRSGSADTERDTESEVITVEYFDCT